MHGGNGNPHRCAADRARTGELGIFHVGEYPRAARWGIESSRAELIRGQPSRSAGRDCECAIDAPWLAIFGHPPIRATSDNEGERCTGLVGE
jgi:hypothetical protein